LFPGAVFVVGVDTAERIIAPRYYGGEEPMQAALTEIGKQGCRFLVAGRHAADGRFVTLCDVPVPDAFRRLFSAIAADDFRLDISSTQLRRAE
jgi:hypothetical protein